MSGGSGNDRPQPTIPGIPPGMVGAVISVLDASRDRSGGGKSSKKSSDAGTASRSRD